MEKVFDETRALRRTMRDLVALSALPAVWAGYPPRQVAEGLADVLLKTLRLDLVYLRLPAQTDGQWIAVARTAGGAASTEQTRDIGQALAPWLDGADIDSAPPLPNPAGPGSVRVVVIPIGCGRQDGVLVAGSRQPAFPSEEDRLLLNVGANQAAAVLQRKRDEEALRASEQRFRTFVDHATDAFFLHDDQGRILDVNRQACESLGYARDELVGKVAFDFDPDVTPADLENFGRTLDAGGMIAFETRHRRKDGTIFPVEVRGQAFQERGRRFIVSLSRDITDRTRVEAALREAKEAAESANRAKDEFLANVSHEIRTPMNAILGMTELALDSPLTEDQRQSLKTVKAAADNLLRIIDDLLDFSRIEAGKLELKPADFSLRAAVGDTLRTLAVRAHSKGLELVSHVQSDVPDALIGDSGRLRQVLLNLVGNAIKFTEKGEVVVSVRRTTTDDTDNTDKEEQAGKAGMIGADAPGLCPPSSLSVLSVSSVVELLFEVRDTGIGIAPDKQGTIFRAFEQEDTSTTRKYGGTGLGLSIAVRLVDLMGGTITVQSEPGRGSTFAFTARFGKPPHPGGPDWQPGVPPPVQLRYLRVLVVDDNATNGHILQEWLRGWQMDPTAVGDGVAAMGTLWDGASAGRPFPLVLLDARMPDIDGLTLAARIREREAMPAIRIILLTSGDRPGDLARSRELGIAAHLLKPVQQDELLETICRVMSRPAGEAQTAEPAQSPTAVSVPHAAPLNILVAEDDESSAQLMEQLLARRGGHRVRLATNGREALALTAQGAFDLLLLDVHLPELDGFEVVGAIRQRERAAGGRLPVIALTARSRKEDRERCLASGMDDFLTKPASAADLLAAIDRLVPAPLARSNQAGLVPPSDGGLLDAVAVLSACGDDAETLRKLCRAAQTYLPVRVAEVDDALRAQDAPRLREVAHKLCTLLFAFSRTAGDVASELEDQAAQGRLAEARLLVERLSHMAGDLLPMLGGLSLEALHRQAQTSDASGSTHPAPDR